MDGLDRTPDGRPDTTRDNGAALVRRYLEAAAVGDLDAFEVLFAADFVNHRPDGGENRGPDGMREFVRGVLAWITNLSVEVHDLFPDGEYVGARVTLHGTSAATPITITEIQLYRVASGKIAERWYTIDRSTLPR